MTRYTSFRVVLAERSHFELPRIGETVSAAIGPLVRYLGVPDALRGHEPSYASVAAWGQAEALERDAISTGFGTGFHLDRRRFDRALADGVVALGGTVLLDTHFRTARRGARDWELEFETRDRRCFRLSARWVIDAGGHLAPFARSQGARHRSSDRLVGIAATCAINAVLLAHTTLVETTPEGWWYSAPVPSGRAVVVFMTDADRVRVLALHRRIGFHRQLIDAPHTWARLAHGNEWSSPRVYQAHSQLLEPGVGDGWIAAGDALAAFDPVASLGIGHAIVTGIEAARIAEQQLMGNQAAASWDADAAALFSEFQGRARALYGLEQRWPDAAFWARRQQPSACAGPTQGSA